jgi:hypothetical protein
MRPWESVPPAPQAGASGRRGGAEGGKAEGQAEGGLGVGVARAAAEADPALRPRRAVAEAWWLTCSPEGPSVDMRVRRQETDDAEEQVTCSPKSGS